MRVDDWDWHSELSLLCGISAEFMLPLESIIIYTIRNMKHGIEN